MCPILVFQTGFGARREAVVRCPLHSVANVPQIG